MTPNELARLEFERRHFAIDPTEVRCIGRRVDAIERTTSRLEAWLETINTRWDARHSSLDSKIDTRFEAIGSRLDTRARATNDTMDRRFDSIGSRLDSTSSRIDTKIGHLRQHTDEKFDAVISRVGNCSTALLCSVFALGCLTTFLGTTLALIALLLRTPGLKTAATAAQAVTGH